MLGQARLGLGESAQADSDLHAALTRARAVNVVDLELPALISLARLALARQDKSLARDQLAEVWDAAKHGPYALHRADAFNTLAEIERAESDTAAAIVAATEAYTAAWCDGPPYAYHWGLEAAKRHLDALGAPHPDLPPFDESKFEPLPDVELLPEEDTDPSA